MPKRLRRRHTWVALVVLAFALVVYLVPGRSTAPASPSSSTRAGAVPTGCHFRGSGLYAMPDPRCSPGAADPAVTQGNLDETICKSGYSSSVRPPESVTEPEKLKVMHAYGISGSPHGYELDHIISLELGGAPNRYKNYYSEPDYHRSNLGFFLNPKDHVEDALHRLVCDRQMTLRKAQHVISTNWAAEYHHLYG